MQTGFIRPKIMTRFISSLFYLEYTIQILNINILQWGDCMFILSKNKDILIKPISIWIEGTDNENIKNIMMNDGSKVFNMGSYEVEYAKEQIEEILKSLNYEYNFIRMFTDDDIEEFEKSKQYLNFNNVFEPINDKDIPF